MIWPILLMTLIFVQSSLPGSPDNAAFRYVPYLAPTLQNALHVPAYAVLQFFWLRAIHVPEKNVSRTILLGVFLTCGFGVLDELYQGIVPGRFSSIVDVLLNLIGCFLGTLVWLGTMRMKKSKPTSVHI
jgi:VanZ family protein